MHDLTDRLAAPPSTHPADPWIAAPDDPAWRVLRDEIDHAYRDMRTARVAPSATIAETRERVSGIDREHVLHPEAAVGFESFGPDGETVLGE